MEAKEIVPFEKTLSTEQFIHSCNKLFAGYYCGSGTVHSEGWTWVGKRLKTGYDTERVTVKETVHIFK